MRKPLPLFIFIIALTVLLIAVGLRKRVFVSTHQRNFAQRWNPIQRVPKSIADIESESNLQAGMDDRGNTLAMWTYFDFQNLYHQNPLAAFVIFTSFRSSQDGQWKEASITETYTIGSKPKLSMDKAGNAFLVFLKNNALWAKEYNTGQGWKAPLSLTKNLSGDILGNYPMSGLIFGDPICFRMNRKGDAALLFFELQTSPNSENIMEPSPLHLQLYVTTYASSEKKWTEPQKLSEKNLDGNSVANLFVAEDGQVFIAWSEADFSGGKEVIHSRLCPIYQGSCESLSDFDTTANKDFRVTSLSAFLLNDGSQNILWIRSDSGRSQTELQLRAHQKSNPEWAKPIVFAKGEGILPWTLDAHANSTGDALVSWIQEGKSQERIFAKSFQAQKGWSHNEMITHFDTGNITETLSIGLDDHGNALATWIQHSFLTQSVFTAEYTSETGWGEPVSLSGDTLDKHKPLLVQNSKGDALVFWFQEEQGPDNCVSRLMKRE